MLNLFSNPTVAHLVAGLAGIGALAGLAATGTVPSGTAENAIVGIVGVLLGSSAVSVGVASQTPTPPAAATSNPVT
jgi:uncharacterized membrane protein YeaQ/YmgE (transglycosylase-associated protein family)